jgi:putative peptide zinc metalloprotease protein
MRFDGYFLLSDAVGLPNLHERSFAIARWCLRERLFGWGDAPPEAFSPERQRWLVVFALATWLYRLVLFFGIALLVYNAFFKVLGVVLMAVELGWFIARPVLREFSVWWQRRRQWRWNRRSRFTVGVTLALLVLLVWPWQADTRAPGLLGARQAQALYAPYAAQVDGAMPKPGTPVRAGQVLVLLRSPDLASRLALAKAREQQLQWQLSQQPFDERLMEAGPALRKRVDAAAAEVAGLHDEMRRLSISAPFDGIVAEVSEDVHAGSWIPAGQRLMRVIGPHEAKVDAFIDEAGLAGVAPGQAAVFVPTMAQEPTLHCEVVGIDAVQLASLDAPGIGSPEGGDVPAQRAADGRLLPLQPVFRVRLERCDRAAVPRIEMLGTVHLPGQPRSLAGRALDRLAQLWQREASL